MGSVQFLLCPASPPSPHLPLRRYELKDFSAKSFSGGWGGFFSRSDVCCFAETQYGVLCVEVERGEDLLACDDGGVSDPYFKVKYGAPHHIGLGLGLGVTVGNRVLWG
jgi:hypothetical protein